jgi:putative transcriptional regulator
MERWESGKAKISGPAVPLLTLIKQNPDIIRNLELPKNELKVRLYYMNGNTVCTVIDVDDMLQKVRIRNYTDNLLYRAFGRNEHPTYKDYEEFLESRCFPAGRDKMKIMLKQYDLPFYDPFLIIEKTEGRMAEDDFWIKIER